MFGLFAGAPGVGGRQERRRQFALGPSQIANLPGNFPMPRTCASATPRRRKIFLRDTRIPNRARFGACDDASLTEDSRSVRIRARRASLSPPHAKRETRNAKSEKRKAKRVVLTPR